METVQIETTQHVEIDYEIAGVGDRILAALVDYIILIGYMLAVGFTFNLFGAFESANNTGMMALGITLLLPYFFYDLLSEIFMHGQSVGKKVLKIKVAKLDGSQPDVGSYLLRWLLRFVDVSIMSGAIAIIAILVNGKGQRIGDMAAGTTVVKLKPSVNLDDTILTEIEEDYTPVFSQVSMLNDKDIATVKKVLDFRVSDAKMSNHLVYKTKTALEDKMGVKSDMSPLSFLDTVLKDYNAMVLRQDGEMDS